MSRQNQYASFNRPSLPNQQENTGNDRQNGHDNAESTERDVSHADQADEDQIDGEEKEANVFLFHSRRA